MDRKQRSNVHDRGTGQFLPGLLCCLKSLPLAALLIFAVIIVLPVGQANAALSEATRQLFQAVSVNDIGAVKKAITDGADINAKNSTGMSPADLAVDKGHFIIAHYLLSERGSRKTSPKKLQATKTVAMPLTKKDKKQITKTLTPKKLIARKPAKSGQKLKPNRTKKAMPKPKRVAKRERFEMPPRKPSSRVKPIRTTIAVAPAPGVDAPDGSPPPEKEFSEMPTLGNEPEETQLADEDLDIDEVEEIDEVAEIDEAEPAPL